MNVTNNTNRIAAEGSLVAAEIQQPQAQLLLPFLTQPCLLCALSFQLLTAEALQCAQELELLLPVPFFQQFQLTIEQTRRIRVNGSSSNWNLWNLLTCSEGLSHQYIRGSQLHVSSGYSAVQDHEHLPGVHPQPLTSMNLQSEMSTNVRNLKCI